MARPKKDETLRQITVYLPDKIVKELAREAAEFGRSGASAQIRYIIQLRHQKKQQERGQ